MNEYELIRKIASKFPRAKNQGNKIFGCDAELLKIDNQWWGLTIDEFSPEEDLFTSESPEVLGANLAVATLSDLMAARAKPEFFLQALSLPRNVETSFIQGITSGIRQVLSEAGCFLCGGDTGNSESWRFCGFAMGKIVDNKPLTHRLFKTTQSLWVTGTLGDANFAALQKTPTPRFESRMKEVKFIWKYGTACIDTSGGLMDALWILHTQNPFLRFEIDLDAIPIAAGISDFSNTANIPREAFFLGGAGEYELLFATSAHLNKNILDELRTSNITKIGTSKPRSKPGVFFIRNEKIIGKMKTAPPCPRKAKNVAEHIQEVLSMAQNIFPTV
ncbi:MAG: AIR synthase related protein [candidate division Zixibacteria bacterium]|nr:AIR synthase related protein [candidate division Zixibacteria bacterium]